MLFSSLWFLLWQLLFPLSPSVNVNSLAEDLLRLLSTEGAGALSSTVASSEYKLRATVGLITPFSALLVKNSCYIWEGFGHYFSLICYFPWWTSDLSFLEVRCNSFQSMIWSAKICKLTFKLSILGTASSSWGSIIMYGNGQGTYYPQHGDIVCWPGLVWCFFVLFCSN